MSTENLEYKNLIDEIISLIGDAKYQAVSYANSSLTILFWHIGKRIITHNLGNERAAYGKQIVVTLSRELTNRFGRNYEEKNVRRMIQFAQLFPDFENVVTMSRYLS